MLSVQRKQQIGRWITSKVMPRHYASDGLVTVHNHDFMHDLRFVCAYERGVTANQGVSQFHEWRVYVALWVAENATRLEGDFVECGVNYGFTSSAIMHYLNWDSVGKTFWLLDTFAGVDKRYVTEAEKSNGAVELSESRLRDGVYVGGVDVVRRNFSQWKNQRIVVGAVPDTLEEVTADQVAYLHIDMNNAAPEVAALRHFWPRLAPGAMVLLDDYAFVGYRPQHAAMNELAGELKVPILSLPTGQGLLIKH